MLRTPTSPIGVFDSGVGGLSVLRHIRSELPYEDLLYVADSGYAPYGDKTPEQIVARVMHLGAFLIERGAKSLVIACNTATAAGAAALRARYDLPIVAMEPAVKPAAAATRNGVVGVLATVGTLQSAQFAALLDRFGGDVDVVTQPCPGLVECVERGELAGPAVDALLRRYLEPLLARGADTIVLGCTHYPFLRPLIETIAGADIAIIETGAAVARQLVRRLNDAGLRTPATQAGSETFWSSGNSAAIEQVVRCLWRPDARLSPLP